MGEPPDQRQLWAAFGHAMGAATGLELVMRVALIDRIRKREWPSLADQTQAVAKILGLTFGPTIRSFKGAYPKFGSDEKFAESIGNALDLRNDFAHHFLERRLDGFRSEEGIQLITLECVEATSFFRNVEQYVRDNCPADFDGFFKGREGAAEEYVNNHPFRERLATIKDGKIPDPLP